ncbi:hypothetical protein PFISCL1PPCAC_2510 [Pristionchus fissidentatus]|uniref:Methyltransferase type 11 domain-containing protein n=1 Tax=Pristionchus fissidentatus TaxID=1538716 RepID=A0AAV5UYB9_9BILA|nr:hypothetical protein PFISCL1PPCAC_2510 [Pristionchus fissidentatus]
MLFRLLSDLYFYIFDRLICYTLLKWCSARFNIRFMNLGYVNDEDTAVNQIVHRSIIDSNEEAHVGLYEKTLSLHPQYPSLIDLRLLEVGCGQGGGIEWIRKSHPEISTVLGMDRVAIKESIITGDAHHLPFESSSFDIVVNVESSHLYQDPQQFFHECFRALSSGGHLCWADLRFDNQEKEVAQQAKLAGFELHSMEDITQSVIRGMEKVSARYDKMLTTAPWYIKLFGNSFRETYCAPGTSTYQRYVRREKRYWAACWVKR